MAIEGKISWWTNLVTYYQLQAANQLGVSNRDSRHFLKDDTLASSFSSYQWSPINLNYIDNSWLWGSRNVTVVNNNGSPKSEEEKQQETNREAIFFGVVVGLISSFSVGYFYSRFEGHSEALEKSTNHLNLAKQECRLTGSDTYAKMQSLIEKRNRIDSDKYYEARNDLLSAAVVLTGAIGTIAGGCLSAPMAITAGYIAAFVGSFFFLMNKGIHWNDQQKHNRLREEICRPNPTNFYDGNEGTGSLAEQILYELQELARDQEDESKVDFSSEISMLSREDWEGYQPSAPYQVEGQNG